MADDDIGFTELYDDPELSAAEFIARYDRFERAEFKRLMGYDRPEVGADAQHDTVVQEEEEQTRCTLATCRKDLQKGYWQETSGERNRFCSRKCQRAYHAPVDMAGDELVDQ